MPVHISVEVKAPALDKRLGMPHLRREFPKVLRKVLYGTASKIKKTAKDSITLLPKSGHWYRKTKSGIKHRASRRGEPPASDTGDMLGSITESLLPMAAIVGSTLKHPMILEERGPGGNRQLRPWLKPALEQHRAGIVPWLIRELGKL
jgi:hypothetical protein